MAQTIPVIGRRQFASASGRVPQASAAGSDLGLGQVGEAVANIGTALQRQQDKANKQAEHENQVLQAKASEDARAWTASALSNDHVQWSAWMAKAEQEAPAGAPNHAGKFIEQFDANTDESLKNAPTEQAKRFYGERRAAMRATLYDHAVRFETTAGMKWRDQQWDASIDNVAQVAARDPEQGKTMAAELRALLADSPHQGLAQAKAEKLRESLSKAATLGLIERDPATALRALGGYFGAKQPQPAAAGAAAPDALFQAVVQQESRGRHTDAAGRLTTSPKGALGISQVLPTTGVDPGYGVAPLKDQSEDEYLRFGRDYLGAMLREFGGDQAKALAAYNAGPGAVQQAIKSAGAEWFAQMPAETRDYVAKISGRMATAPVQVASLVASLDPAAGMPQVSGERSGLWFVDQLDPATAWSMHNQARAIVERQQHQAETEAVKREREAGRSYAILSDWARNGVAADPAASAPLLKAIEGTPYAHAYAQLAEGVSRRTAAAMLPVSDQQRALDALYAHRGASGTSQALEHEITEREQILTATRKAYDEDALRAGAERGLLPGGVAPLNTASLDALVSGLAPRVQQASTVQVQAGRAVSPLTPEESGRVSDMLNALPPDQRSQRIAQLHAGMAPAQANALALQIDKKDKGLALEFATAQFRTAAGRYTSEWIGRGRQAIKDKAIKVDDTAEAGLRAQLAAELGDVFAGKTRDDVLEAARLIQIGLQAGGVNASAADALGMAVGGSIVEHNGRRIPITGEMRDEGRFRAALRTYPFQALMQQAPDGFVYLPGGRPMGVPEFLGALPDAMLEPAGHGRYKVRSGGSLVVNQRAQPILIEVAR
jgi:hypothetical protein